MQLVESRQQLLEHWPIGTDRDHPSDFAGRCFASTAPGVAVAGGGERNDERDRERWEEAEDDTRCTVRHSLQPLALLRCAGDPRRGDCTGAVGTSPSMNGFARS